MGADLEIVAATQTDYPIVRNLAHYYVYDMSEHAGFDFADNGQFEPARSLANYWGVEPEAAVDRWPPEWEGFPFLARVGGKLAGFALVRRIAHAPSVFDMGEFFVARKFRRRGTGAELARAMFARFPGRWEVREMLTNTGAQLFWRAVITEFTRGRYTESRERFAAYRNTEFIVQRFESR